MPTEPTGPNGSEEAATPVAQDGQDDGDGPDAEDKPGERVVVTGGDANEPPGRLRFTRRRLLILGGAAAAGVVATIAGVREWGGSGAPSRGSSAPSGASPSASGRSDFPILSVEPPPDVPAEDWILKVDGLVERPLTIDRTTWSGLQRLDVRKDFECVTGWTADNVSWGGVAPSVLLDQAGVRPEARFAAFHAVGHASAGYVSSLPLDLVTSPETVMADTLDGGPLPPKHGGPLRLVVPRQLGYKSVKWVVRIEITEKRVPGYWEQRGYPEDAPVLGA